MLTSEQQKNVLVLSGPSGSGKGTIMNILQHDFDDIERAVSATTRTPRKGEGEGVDYYYITKQQFEENIAQGKLLEYTNYVGNYYGTLHSEVARIVDDGKICVLEIEIEGAANVKKSYPGCKMVFIMAPSDDELENRLRNRGSEDEETITKRLQTAKEEMKHAYMYDHVVANKVAQDCAEEIYAMLKTRQS